MEEVITIDAKGIFYRELNAKLRQAVSNGTQRIKLRNVHGQRYIGTDLDRPVDIEIFGTPGNDLGAFMDSPKIIVHGNAQDGCGNTMNSGEIIIHGHAGDILGLSARGGKIFVREDVGYRAGIHMKEYQDKKPMVVVGGTAQEYLRGNQTKGSEASKKKDHRTPGLCRRNDQGRPHGEGVNGAFSSPAFKEKH